MSTILKKDDNGSAVATMQTMLIACGFSCGPDGADGDFGKNTLAGLTAFQNASGMEATGVYDADTNAALEKARHFKKDGTELLFYHNNIILSWYQGKLNFNPMEEYTFVDTVSGTGAGPLVVRPDAPYKTAEEFIAYAKDHPGEIRVGTELGKNGHCMMALFANAVGLELKFIDAGSSADQLSALLSGSVDIVLMTTTMIQQYVENGDVVPLMTSGINRPAEWPDIPSFSELGSTAVWNVWSTVMGPKDLDPEVVKSFCYYMEHMDDETREALYKVSLDPVVYRSNEDTLALWHELDEMGRTICDLLGTNVR